MSLFVREEKPPSKKVTAQPLEHTLGNPLKQLWKESLRGLLVKVFSGCVPVRCVEPTLGTLRRAVASRAKCEMIVFASKKDLAKC